MKSVMYDLIMKVTYEIKSEMEVSTIKETFNASKMIFVTVAACKRKLHQDEKFKWNLHWNQQDEMKSVNYVANEMKYTMEVATE